MEPTASVDTTVDVETTVEGTTPTSAVPSAQGLDVEQLVADRQRLEAKVTQVLGEKKKAQARLAENETKVQQIFDGLGKLMGLDQEDPDPKALTAQITSLQRQVTEGEINRRATTVAYQKGLDPEIAVPVLRSQGKLNIDLADAGFEAALAAAVDGLAEAQPYLVQGGARVASRPSAVAPTPSGPTPTASLVQEWERTFASGDGDAISRFVREHPAVVQQYYGGGSPGTDSRSVIIG